MARMRPRRSRTRRSARTHDVRSRVRRGHIALVGRVILLVCAVIVLVAPVLLVASPISYVPLIAAILLVVVSAIYLQILKRSFTISIAQMETSCERGSDAGLAVSLTNSSVLPFPRVEMEFFVTDLFGGYDDVRRLTCTLSTREKTDLPFDVRFSHLGTYEAGIERVVLYDLLGLFRSRINEGMRRSVAVRPRKVDLRSVGDMQAVPDESLNMLKTVASDDMDYASVREYYYGDPLKTIHWNLSARSPDATMYTRLFETYVNPALVIIIDPYSPSWDTEDLMSLFDGMVEAACALSAQAREIGIDAEVRYIDSFHAPASTRLITTEDADDLVRDMLRITPTEEATSYVGEPEEMLRSAGLSSHGFGNVALVTSRPDAGFISALIEVRMRKRNPLAFVSVPRSLEGLERDQFLSPLKRLAAAGVPYYVVESTEVQTEVVGL